MMYFLKFLIIYMLLEGKRVIFNRNRDTCLLICPLGRDDYYLVRHVSKRFFKMVLRTSAYIVLDHI